MVDLPVSFYIQKYTILLKTILYGFDFGLLNNKLDDNKIYWFYNNHKLPSTVTKSPFYNDDIYRRAVKSGVFYANYRNEVLASILIVFSYTMIMSFWLF
jgi:hypothetical protein